MQAFGKVDSILAGHVVVEQDEANGPLRCFRCLQCFSGGSGGVGQHRLHVPVLQHLAEDASVREVVVHDQHRQFVERIELRRCGPMLIGCDAKLGGEVKCGTTADFAVDPNAAVHHLHKLPRNRQSQAGAAEAPRGR